MNFPLNVFTERDFLEYKRKALLEKKIIEVAD